MEMAAKLKTELALSGLFRVVGILDKNFRHSKTTEEIKHLNDFTDQKIEKLIREAESKDLVRLMPLLEELQAAALELENQLDLYEYKQIEKRFSSSYSEPVPEKTVLPTNLRNGLKKLLKIVERVGNKNGTAQPQADTIPPTTPAFLPPSSVRENQHDSFIDSLVREYRIARPVIQLAISDISRIIIMLGSNFHHRIPHQKIFEQLKDVVIYHIRVLITNVNLDGSARSKQLQYQLKDMLQDACLQISLFDPYKYGDYTVKQLRFFDPIPIRSGRFKLIYEEPVLSKSPLRIGLGILLKFIERMEGEDQFTAWRGMLRRQANTVTPTLRIGVEKWLKFVEQVEKKHPFKTSKEVTIHAQANAASTLKTTFSLCRGLFATMSLENVESQEDAMEILRNHKKTLRKVAFGWTDTSTDTCEVVLETLEPDPSLEILAIICYSSAKFPNWMVKENWLPHLHTLQLVYCKNLKKVPFLPPHLRKLQVEKCHELIQLPFVGDTLQILYLGNCPKLMLPLPFNNSFSLRDVRIINCSRKENPLFIDMSFLTNLEQLELAGFSELQALTNLSPTTATVVIKDCPMLTILANLQRCTSLERLSINKCPMIRREETSLVEGVAEGYIAVSLPKLTHVHTDDPSVVLDLVHQQALSSIIYLHLRDCAALSNLEKLTSLENLQIKDCPDVELLPNLPVSLRYLSTGNCPKLKEMYGEGGRLHSTISHIPNVSIY